MVHVPDVECELLLPAERVAAVDLGPPRDAGAHVMTPCLRGGVERQVVHHEWSRTDQAHVALHHIPEFRQFVQAGCPNEAPDPRKALGVRQQMALRITGVGHGTELDQLEGSAAQTGPNLPKEDGAAEPQPDEDGYQQQNRQPQGSSEDHQQEVDGALHDETEPSSQLTN